MKNPYKNAVVD